MLERRLAEAESYTCAFLEAAERRAAEELMAAVDRLHAAQRDVAGAGNTAATRALERQALDQAAVASAVAVHNEDVADTTPILVSTAAERAAAQDQEAEPADFAVRYAALQAERTSEWEAEVMQEDEKEAAASRVEAAARGRWSASPEKAAVRAA